MLKIHIVWVLLFSVFIEACTPAKKEKMVDTTRPNIIIIFTDDQGYQDLGVNGSPDILTPNVDKLATEGLRFTQFYTAQPVCSASRTGLLTGCYPNRLGINGALFPGSLVALNHAETTIAELVKPLGYATAMFGKWHLGDKPEYLPTHHGFDEYLGLPYSNDMWPVNYDGTPFTPEQNDRNFDFPPLPLIEGDSAVRIIASLEDQAELTTIYTERAIQFITQHKDSPFFLYLAHSMPHVPLAVSPKFAGKSHRGMYGDVIMEIDWSVGEIMKTLQQFGLEQNTIVVFTSDNGPWLNFGKHSGVALPLREGKGTVLEGGVRVPCIVKWPEVVAAGVVQTIPAMTIDLLPTIADILGIDVPALPIDGISVLPIIKNASGAENPHQAYFFYYNRNELQGALSGDGRWKLYFPHKYRSLEGRSGRDDGYPIDYNNQMPMGLELYDLENDISETTNVADKYPEVVQQLSAFADSCRIELGDELTGVIGRGNREPGRIDVGQ